MTKIILATISSSRKEAFKSLGLDFIAEGSNVEEYFDGRPNHPEELTQCLAKLKAESVAKNHKEGIVIGFDSILFFNNQIIEKPKSREEAYNRLKSLSGNKCQYYTGIYIINLETNKTLSDFVKTDVFIRELKEEEINKYLYQGSDFKTHAWGFNPSKLYSSTFIKKIEGSPFNAIQGIPLEKIMEMLFQIEYKLQPKNNT